MSDYLIMKRRVSLLDVRIEELEAEVRAWRECARYDPQMSGRGMFKGWDRSALDRCRKKYIQEE